MTAGLSHPEQYGSIGSQCGMVDIAWAIETRDFLKIKHKRMFGPKMDVAGTAYDFYYMTEQMAGRPKEEQTRIFHCWTTEDYLREINEKFHKHCCALELDYTWKVVDGPHGWGNNDAGLKSFLEWLARDYYQRRDS